MKLVGVEECKLLTQKITEMLYKQLNNIISFKFFRTITHFT